MTKTDIANLALSKIGETLITSIDDTGDKRARLAKLHYEPALREILRAHFWGFAMTVAKCDPSELLAIEVEAEHLPGSPIRLLAAGDSGGRPMFSSDGRTVQNLETVFPWTCAFWDPDETRWETHCAKDLQGSSFLNWTSSEDVATPLEVVTWAEGSGAGAGGGDLVLRLAWPDDLPDVYAAWQSGWKLPADFIKLRKLLTADGGKIEGFDLRRINGERCLVTRDFSEVRIDYVQFVDDPADYDPVFVTAFVTLLASRLARAISGSEKAESDLLALYQNVDLPAARTADGHDSQSSENHPLREFLDGTLTPGRGDFFPGH